MISKYELSLILILLFICFTILIIISFNYGFIKGKRSMLQYLTEHESDCQENDENK